MPLDHPSPTIDTSPKVADEVKYTTCYMCACRCGIKVHLRDGRIRYIEGNRNHPVNKGVLCAKGSAGIMQQYSPAKLTAPLLRVGERGKGEFKEISWDEALDIVTKWLGDIRKTDPRKLAFFTGRDQSQALTGWWASQFGTPNYAAHGGFCSVNMAAAGMYTLGGSFWEFGEADWERSKYFLMFGVAEDHASNPIKIGLSKLRARGAKFVSVNPIRTGYSAVADEWIGITPGTDGLFVAALIHELLSADKIDFDYLTRYTNAAWLVIQAPGAADDGLIARDSDGTPLTAPKLAGAYKLDDGRSAVPVFQLLAQRFLDSIYAPEAVADKTGVPAATIRRIAAELAHAAFDQAIEIDQPWTDWRGQRHAKTIGRPVAMHAMRGISAHANGFHTCRLIHVLQLLLGSVDVPGGFRHRPPYPKSAPPENKPAGKPHQVAPGKGLGAPLGYPMGPQDLIIDAAGRPARIDRAFSWEAPFAAHGMMHMVIANAHAANPYPIDTLFFYMANMSWNSAMNTSGTMQMLADKNARGDYRIPHIIYSDAYFSEMVAYADLVLPDTTYLERFDCISLLDRPISDADGAADAIRQPIIAPDRDVRPFQDVLIDLGARLKLPGLTESDGSPRFSGYADYVTRHQRAPGIGLLGGWRGADQVQSYIDNQCFWREELPESARFYKFANRDYLDYAAQRRWIGAPEPIVMQIYAEPLQRFRLAAQGHGRPQPPDAIRARVERYFDPLPFWHEPFEEAVSGVAEFPLHAVTQRPMAMYHAWHSQNAWLRQIHGANRLYVARVTAERMSLADDDWVWITSRQGRVKAQIRLMDGVNPHTVWTWNAIGKRAGAWNLTPDAPEANEGFLLNHLIAELLPPRGDGYRYANSDPVTGQAAWYDLRVRIEKADEAGTQPRFEPLRAPQGLPPRPDILRYGAKR